MSMLRNLATSLINSREERIVTTLPKAKELRPFVERAITLSCRARSLEGEGAKAGSAPAPASSGLFPRRQHSTSAVRRESAVSFACPARPELRRSSVCLMSWASGTRIDQVATRGF